MWATLGVKNAAVLPVDQQMSLKPHSVICLWTNLPSTHTLPAPDHMWHTVIRQQKRIITDNISMFVATRSFCSRTKTKVTAHEVHPFLLTEKAKSFLSCLTVHLLLQPFFVCLFIALSKILQTCLYLPQLQRTKTTDFTNAEKENFLRITMHEPFSGGASNADTTVGTEPVQLVAVMSLFILFWNWMDVSVKFSTSTQSLNRKIRIIVFNTLLCQNTYRAIKSPETVF